MTQYSENLRCCQILNMVQLFENAVHSIHVSICLKLLVGQSFFFETDKHYYQCCGHNGAINCHYLN